MPERTVAEVEDEMRAESVQPHPDDARLYALQAERDALLAGEAPE
jgi:hypothetical protein